MHEDGTDSLILKQTGKLKPSEEEQDPLISESRFVRHPVVYRILSRVMR